MMFISKAFSLPWQQKVTEGQEKLHPIIFQHSVTKSNRKCNKIIFSKQVLRQHFLDMTAFSVTFAAMFRMM